MANEQTSVPLYAASEVLTAANMNISAGTGVPVFATTVTRDAAFGGASEKVLAEGQLCYLSSTNVVQYYDGAAWATVGPAAAAASGLTLISATTIGNAVSSVTVSSVFSSTYDNYKIMISGGVGSSSDTAIALKLGSTTTNYYEALFGLNYTDTASSTATNNGSSFTRAASIFSTSVLFANIDILNPNLAKRTIMNYYQILTTLGRVGIGVLDNATQYTDFTLTPATGTLTGGTIRVYGYQNS